MLFWRIVRQRFAAESVSGEGARLFGGRWNSRGVRVVYASTSLALAAVETFINLEPKILPADLLAIKGEIPDEVDVARLNPQSLPEKWNEARDERLRRIGDRWVREASTVALLVPSAAIAGEWNLLLNPVHSQFGTVHFFDAEPFRFDLRMFA